MEAAEGQKTGGGGNETIDVIVGVFFRNRPYPEKGIFGWGRNKKGDRAFGLTDRRGLSLNDTRVHR